MKKIFRLGLLIGLLSACENPAPPAASSHSLQATEATETAVVSLRGMYKIDANGAFFYDCSAAKTYRVSARPPEMDSLYREACQPAPYPGEPAYAVVQGQIAPAARVGDEEALTITRVDTLEARTMYNSCQPYDFWCIGTEPFWGLVISRAEGGISLKSMGEDKGKVFPWASPRSDGASWTYVSVDPASGEKLSVSIRREACSDGMSDRQYDYSVEFRIGGESFSGCAIKGQD